MRCNFFEGMAKIHEKLNAQKKAKKKAFYKGYA
jgi:hypothetical protein